MTLHRSVRFDNCNSLLITQDSRSETPLTEYVYDILDYEHCISTHLHTTFVATFNIVPSASGNLSSQCIAMSMVTLVPSLSENSSSYCL